MFYIMSTWKSCLAVANMHYIFFNSFGKEMTLDISVVVEGLAAVRVWLAAADMLPAKQHKVK